VERVGARAQHPLDTRTPGPKKVIREVKRQEGGAAYPDCGCSSLQVPGWWMFRMNSHGVEIATAGCVSEMLRDPHCMPFFFFTFFYFIFFFFFTFFFYFILFYFIFYFFFIFILFFFFFSILFFTFFIFILSFFLFLSSVHCY